MKELTIYEPEKLTIKYTQKGKGKEILFIPGGNLDAEYYKYFIDHLAAHHKVTAINWPGFKGSTRPKKKLTNEYFNQMIAEIIERLGLKNVSLVGHSMSAGVIANFAATTKTPIYKIVLFSPVTEKFHGSILKLGLSVSKNYLKHQMEVPHAYLSPLKVILNTASRLDQSVVHGKFVVNFQRENWENIKAPTLAILGSRDEVLIYENQVKAVQTIPNVTIKQLDAGHDSVFTYKARAIEMINEFI